ncbi:MAG: peptidoglycan editing factor PgeF [Betaproteobacteria bacterium]|nr:peptidoglycan editing factor PgeF [Betaproteobacteria bacterium]
MNESWIIPDWPAPANVHAVQTTRAGGVSTGGYASLNLGDHVGDDPAVVATNRAILRLALPAEPIWLKQVHGNVLADADRAVGIAEADAAVARKSDVVCAVMTADCLPLLLCDESGTVVCAVHAGWRGLAGGVIEAAVAAMKVAPASLLVWLGPAIGPQAFEVGEEVRQAFLAYDPDAQKAFVPHAAATEQKWLADIYLLARQRLGLLGVTKVYGGGLCTFSDEERFFSYRRDGATGRLASLIWLDS